MTFSQNGSLMLVLVLTIQIQYITSNTNEILQQPLLRRMAIDVTPTNKKVVNDISLAESSVNSSRRLQGDGMMNFTTLTCNANVALATCQTWTSKFGTSHTYKDLITIPCGTCISMDYTQTEQLDLLGGIDIQGRFVFPDGYKISITTPMIVVQGELVMTSTKPINGIPDVRITMIGQNDKQTFTPIDNNANACNFGSATCTVGKKAIVVAGGKINIHGLPTNTKTWTKVYDAVGGSDFNNPDTIYIENVNIKGKWVVGAEIIVTSHTRMYNDTQLRTIVDVSNAPVSGYSVYKLNAPIIRPTTMVESPDFHSFSSPHRKFRYI